MRAMPLESITKCVPKAHIRAVFLLAMAATLSIATAASPASRSVSEFGVKGDGAEAETSLIQGAIDACAVDGGCTLHFPPGRYVTGTLYFRDNITLHLAPGAVLATSSRAEDYTAPALLYGKGVNAIALTGGGEIQAGPVPAADETSVRNPGSRLLSLILIENATNVRVDGVRFLRSPAWTIALHVVDGAFIDDVLIENAALAPNTGGVVLDSSSHISIQSLNFRGGGDGIMLQTSLVDGVAPPCESITISNSTFRSASMAIRIGARTHGDIRNVTVANSVIESSQGGIGILMRDGAAVESVLFSNLVIETAPLFPDRAEWPVLIDLKRRTPDSPAGRIEGISFSGVRLLSSGKVLVSGMAGHPIRNLRLAGVSIDMHSPAEARRYTARPSRAEADTVVGEDETATALLFGYVADSFIRDLQVNWAVTGEAEDRHALFVHSTDGLSLDGVTARQGKVGGARSAMHFMAARNIEIRNSTAPPRTGVWIEAQGLGKHDFFFSGNNTANAYRDVVYTK